MFFRVETELWRDEALVARERYYIQAPLQADAEAMASHAATTSPFWHPGAAMRASFKVGQVPQDSIPPGSPVLVATLSDRLAPADRDAAPVRPGLHIVAARRMDWPDDVVEPDEEHRAAMRALTSRVAISDATGALIAMEGYLEGLGLPRNDRPANPPASVRLGIEFSGAFLLAMAGDRFGPTAREVLETLGGHVAASVRVRDPMDGPTITYDILDHHGRKVAEATFERTLAAAEILGCPNVAYTTLSTLSETGPGGGRAGEIPLLAFCLLTTFQAEHDIRQIQESLDQAGIHAHLSVSMDFSGDGRHNQAWQTAYGRMRAMMAGWEDVFPSASGRVVPERLVLGREEVFYQADITQDVEEGPRP